MEAKCVFFILLACVTLTCCASTSLRTSRDLNDVAAAVDIVHALDQREYTYLPFQFCAWFLGWEDYFRCSSFIFIYLSLLPQSSLLCKVRFLEVGALSYETNKTPNHSRYSSRQHRSRQPPPSRPSSSLSSLSSSPHGAAAARPCHTSAVSIVTCTSQPTVAPTTWGQQDETMKGSFVTGVA